MLESKELVKEFFENRYPIYKIRYYDKMSNKNNSFNISYFDDNNYPMDIDVSMIDFVTFVYNKINKELLTFKRF